MSYLKTSQNADNFISDRSSTRIHAPPGGGSSMGSLLFGGDDKSSEAPKKSSRGAGGSAPLGTRSSPFGISEEKESSSSAYSTSSSAPISHETKKFMPSPSSSSAYSTSSFSAVSSNKFANGASQNTGNFITERSTTRLNAPPGGKSSMGGILSWE